MFNKKVIKSIILAAISVLTFYGAYALADDINIGTVVTNISGTLTSVMKLITAGSYMAGFALTVGALFKFKQHHTNPQQVQLGTCITMLLVGVALIFLPSVLSTTGTTIFGSGSAKQEGSISGFSSTTGK
jgi:intracellular multiplication protein IcmD